MPCKPIVLCSALLLNQKRKQKQENSFLEVVVNPTLSRRSRSRGRSRGAVRDGRCLPKHLDNHKCNHIHSHSHSRSHSHSHSQNKNKNKNKSIHTRTNDSYRGSSSQAHRDFIESTASVSGSNGDIISLQEMPTCEIAHSRFIAAYPRFSETRALDQLRATEYSHLDDEDLVCLDYCGFGLLSHAQREEEEEEFFMEAEAEAEAEEEEERRRTSDFMLTEVSANLWAHALFGSAPEGSMEHGIRSRIMEYLNIPESEYSLVFTASRGSSFKLLANAYPWSTTSRLVTMYDYESESVGWMEQRAAEKGARVFRARFRWPSLRVCSSELKLELLLGSSKRAISKKLNQACLPDHSSSPSPLHNSSRLNIVNWFDRVSHYHHQQQQCQSKTAKNDEKKKGLFVFPVQSRVTGAKYSYQWMSLAQKNQWHVMLDASALGPKDMDSLGLSLFRPDFITASFYKLFGGDPSGFGCLLIKNSVAQSIQDPSGAQVSGMVRIVPAQPRQFCSASSPSPSPSPSSSGNSEAFDIAEMISSFSGPVMNIPTFNELKMPSRMPPLCHVPENSSIDGVVMSPACSEEGNDDTDCNNAFFADAPALSPASSVCEDEPKAPTPPSNIVHLPQGRKDQRMRIKDLCSGLLHLRTGRVGNSADGNGEDDISVKDGVKIFPEEQDTSPTMLKHNNTQSQKSEGIPERLVLVLKKERGDGELKEQDGVKIFPEKECTDLTTFKHQMSEESMVAEKLVLVLKKEREDGELKEPVELLEKVVVVDQRGLETIEEIEAEAEEDGPSILSVQRLNDDRLGAVPSTLKDNAICRETEGGFRLLGRRSSDHFSLSRVLCAVAGENNEPSRSRSICSGAHEEFSFRRSSGVSKSDNDEDQVNEDEEIMGDEGGEEEEPQLICGGLDHADMMGLHRTSSRLRFLINWLITSLLRLKHPSTHAPLVKIYGPRVRYDRGASVAFNVFDSHGNLVHPEVVRMLADQLNICLGLGFLRNIHFRGGGATNEPGFGDLDATDKLPFRVEVVTAALGLLSDFRDVYKLWVFMARFLDPEYVSRELSDHVIPSSM